MMNKSILKFVLDSQIVEIDFSKTDFRPSTTVLNYLRMLPEHRGTKEGCAEGDCGACTVVLGELGDDARIHYKAVDSCMLSLASIHGKQLITVENLAQREGNEIILHPVQKAMVDEHGSQCGFCTPGIVMSLFAFYKSGKEANRDNIVDALSGNLCRCTGYQPIINAAKVLSSLRQPDHFDANEQVIIKMLKEIKSDEEIHEFIHSKQTYYLPKNLKQALSIKDDKTDAYIVNGTTDTAIRQNKQHEYLPTIIDISAVPELKEIRSEVEGCYIGAGASIEEIKKFFSKFFPELKHMLGVFASHQIRNVATLGGNLCTASPIGDLIPLMFALKAKFEIVSENGGRWVDAEDFIVGYRKNCLFPDELLMGIYIPKIDKDEVIKTEKVSNRHDLDISTVSLAVRLSVDSDNIVREIILAYGGMAEVIKRARNVEEYLIGKEWTREVVESAKDLINKDFTPISDARASKEYRQVVAGNILLRLVVD